MAAFKRLEAYADGEGRIDRLPEARKVPFVGPFDGGVSKVRRR